MKKIGIILIISLSIISCSKNEQNEVNVLKKNSGASTPINGIEDLIATGLGEVVDVPAGYELQNPEWPYLDVKLFVPYDGSTPHEIYVFTPEDIEYYSQSCDKSYQAAGNVISCKGSGSSCYVTTAGEDITIHTCD